MNRAGNRWSLRTTFQNQADPYVQDRGSTRETQIATSGLHGCKNTWKAKRSA